MMPDMEKLELLKRLHPLASLGGMALRELVPMCRVERVTRNLDPFRLRDWEGQVVFLSRGQLKVDLEDGSASVLVGGSGDALAPLACCGKYPVASKAITDVELVCFDEEALDIVLTWDQVTSAATRKRDTDAEAADWSSLSGSLAMQTLARGAFASLPPAHIDALLQRFQRLEVPRGQVVVREGDPGDYYYLIERGRCVVTRQVGGSHVELAELEAGAGFGEEALVAETPRNATVTMKTTGILLRLANADFVELLREPLLHRLDAGAAAVRITAGATWIDVRFPAEYQYDGLPGALNIPLNELRAAMSMLDPAREYIVYCQTGRRSSAAAFLLSQHGFKAFLLAGGLKGVGGMAGMAAMKERMAT